MRKWLFVMQCPISSENQAKKGAENFLPPAGINRVVGHKRVGGGGGGLAPVPPVTRHRPK
jgi:hypothetical protein